MSDIPIEYGPPIVVTKDRSFDPSTLNFMGGAVWILPEDAVLIWPKESVNKEVITNDR